VNAQFIIEKTNILPEDPDFKYWAERPCRDLQSRWETTEGKKKLEALRSSGFSDQAIQKLGQYNGQIDLRGIPLSGQTFKDKTLDHIDFYAADLSECTFSKCSLENCWLSEANIKGTKFEWCNMHGVLIDNPAFNENTTFTGINLSQINFTLAVLLQDLAEDQRRIQHIEKHSPRLAKFLKHTCNYGRSLGKWFL
jgi:uncharacterized protein YjbI with pentapeptide repeats